MMNQRALWFAILAMLGTFGAASTTAAGGSDRPGKRCPAGFVRVAVPGRRVCRQAPDLRVSVAATPTANRVGGTFSYEVTVRNVGRKARAARHALRGCGRGHRVDLGSHGHVHIFAGPAAQRMRPRDAATGGNRYGVDRRARDDAGRLDVVGARDFTGP
jgi:hypothetical protein